MKYPDHFALYLELANLPLRNIHIMPPAKHTAWNTRKHLGWDKYRSFTNNNAKLERAAVMVTDEPGTILKSIERELTSIKHICFGKVTVSMK